MLEEKSRPVAQFPAVKVRLDKGDLDVALFRVQQIFLHGLGVLDHFHVLRPELIRVERLEAVRNFRQHRNHRLLVTEQKRIPKTSLAISFCPYNTLFQYQVTKTTLNNPQIWKHLRPSFFKSLNFFKLHNETSINWLIDWLTTTLADRWSDWLIDYYGGHLHELFTVQITEFCTVKAHPKIGPKNTFPVHSFNLKSKRNDHFSYKNAIRKIAHLHTLRIRIFFLHSIFTQGALHVENDPNKPWEKLHVSDDGSSPVAWNRDKSPQSVWQSVGKIQPETIKQNICR